MDLVDLPYRRVVRSAFELSWRTFLIGLALFILPPFAMAPTLEQRALALIVIVIWCYYDGAVWRRSWRMALVEGTAWFFCASKWTQALLLVFGSSEIA
jgi:hypothetical protein